MKKSIGCFHAHYSNIVHVEHALAPYEVELVHFVDPGLDRLKADADFTPQIAQKKVKDTLDWITACRADAILITCTYFSAMIEDNLFSSVPVIAIDDPLFHLICESDKPYILVFTNPETVDGTMNRLHLFSKRHGKAIQVQPFLLENTFELIMRGRQKEYTEKVAAELERLTAIHPDKAISAAQLSMAPAAEIVEAKTGPLLEIT
ncbi:hypothetical protein ACI7RC_00275 [Brevibacillus sp. B_LB10_24]|uniref:hypothetical protein n=1 Tax=Brevibacillus sp. B_LB10_24 TaxID=3380645 RepID=UPI0038B6FAF5